MRLSPLNCFLTAEEMKTRLLGVSNTPTTIARRVEADTTLNKAQMDELVERVKAYLPFDHIHTWNANINGVIIQLTTNNHHLMDFWVENWFPALLEGIQPHGLIYAITNIPGEKSRAYYCSSTKTAVIINSDYYGQCKSWALGIVADLMEMQRNIQSLHAGVVDIGGCGIAIIAPTGVGKSTLSYGLTLALPNGRCHSDDWCYVDFLGGRKQGRVTARISERKFYIRTDLAEAFPQLSQLFSRCKLENVGDTFTSIPNSRAMLDPLWIGGPDSFVPVTRLRVVLLLRRDTQSPPEEELDSETALDILQKGEYTILPGAGPQEEWGKVKREPFYNPYLLVTDEERMQLRVEFFRQLLALTQRYIFNTGVQSVEETCTRALRIAHEASKRLSE